MSERARIALKFSDDTEEVVRSRMLYAFRVFAAIYNYQVVQNDTVPNGATVFYGRFPDTFEMGKPRVAARYRLRSPKEIAPIVTKREYAGEIIPAFHGF